MRHGILVSNTMMQSYSLLIKQTDTNFLNKTAPITCKELQAIYSMLYKLST